MAKDTPPQSIYQRHHVPSSADNYLKLKDGDRVKLRITTDPVITIYKQGDRPRYGWVVWNHTAEKAQIYIAGVTVFQAIADLVEDWGEPETFDFTVKRTGAGPNDTTYSVAPVPKSIDLTEEQVKACEELVDKLRSKGKWLIDYEDDNILPAPSSGEAVVSDAGPADQEEDI